MKNVEIPKWLEKLPLAPEFHPTDTEFADPIAYISKIEKEASAFGICKVIPPLPKPSRKYVLHNLNKSLSKCPELGSDANLVNSSKTDGQGGDNCERSVNGGENRAVFTTRHQELGCEKGKRVVGAQKQVWQSGEVYTLEQFEVKSKNFAKSHLGMVKDVNPLAVEAMFWKAASEKPIYVEYANDVPGSGFGEPEGLFRYFDRRRRRKRKRDSFDRNNIGDSDSKKDDLLDKVNSIRGNKASDSQNSLNFCTETASNSSHNDASFSGRKDSQGSGEMEGSAGWKLANSPWNLQVIARSPGSLTRFMPDDIPGVTSPMVYIGMLFSWFAWHVEDHELHSLNFLHIGSPKTWYSVPGDYAFDFEEAVRLRGYGGNSDRLVALSLLGEKTTVMSPEVIVMSGIPCCRLVQNPGEFVVTFPRAYHIGFSHGFNCGEAANFGTPKWLAIAKEAAVRRAAMNYLPMLSHQQLLYLLTMSFISRIPRSLLPGVRSSRLRDRQKEERELLVKRAFIEDILQENNLLTLLLLRNSSYHAVLWDVESMPSSIKESEFCKDADAAMPTSTGKDSPENDDNNNIIINDVDQLSKYISEVGFDLNDDDLAYDFQIESGTLPCVACGILGFPFMAVVQPSEVASLNLLLKDPFNVSDLSHVVDKSTKGTGQTPAPDDSSSLNHEAVSSKVDDVKRWDISNVFLKPRIFCLEHAIEIEQHLSSKGGANVLVICHSDFQKIKTHAEAIADEIAVPFCYTEIPIGNGTPEDLNLIDIAIDREEQVDCLEDWTSQLSINLQHCVKVKRSSPSTNVEHLLSLGALFSGATSISNAASSVKWLSRKLRSKRHLKKLLQSKPSDGNEVDNENQRAKKDVKIIQYSRKRYRASTSAGIKARIDGNNSVVLDILDNQPEGQNKEDEKRGGSVLTSTENNEKTTGSVLASTENNAKSLSGLSNLASETVGSTSDENGAENKTMNESSKTCDGPTENNDMIEEVCIHGDSSNSEVSKSSSSAEEEEDNQTKGDNQENAISRNTAQSESTAKAGSKRKREVGDPQLEYQFRIGGFIKSPCEGLRPRAREDASSRLTDNKKPVEEKPTVKNSKKATTNHSVPQKNKKEHQKGRHYKCELDGCTMSFHTKAELDLHKANRCPVKGCRKKFNSHKYAIQHQRVHDDDRPLKCPWEGCPMSFKWAWARTEHLRVHTGERPYVCKVKGCGLTFRFVSDFSRHRRKTGHYVDPTA